MNLNFEAAFMQSPAASMILDDSLRFVAANPAYLKMVGRTANDVLGRYVFEAFPESEDRVRQMKDVFERSLDGANITISEIPFRITVDGAVKEHWWTARHAQLESSTDKTRFVIQFTENVTN